MGWAKKIFVRKFASISIRLSNLVYDRRTIDPAVDRFEQIVRLLNSIS